MQGKYGNDWEHIDASIKDLIKMDAAKGIKSKLVFVDDETIKKFSATAAVSDYTSETQNKKTIDKLYKHFDPDYLLILGSCDVIPHVKLKNLIRGDDDEDIDSDLPYACEKPFSRNINDFISPTRVVGRLPDITGGNDYTYLDKLIKHVIQSKPKQIDEYSGYFALSTWVWKKSTEASVKNIFGEARNLHLSPPSAGPYTADLKNKIHFFNCHGDTLSNEFYGEKSGKTPSAFNANFIPAKIPFGTVVAAECCYGAELYDADFAETLSICNTYLQHKALAYVGSTTIAYGPASGQGLADLITQYFIINIREGFSAGRAFLEARQKFIRQAKPYIDATELKTLAQFILLGDPSVHFVLPHTTSTTISALTEEKNPFTKADERKARRVKLKEIGNTLQKIIDTPKPTSKLVSAELHAFIKNALHKYNFKNQTIISFDFERAHLLEGKSFRKASPGHHICIDKEISGGKKKNRILVIKDIGIKPQITLYESK